MAKLTLEEQARITALENKNLARDRLILAKEYADAHQRTKVAKEALDDYISSGGDNKAIIEALSGFHNICVGDELLLQQWIIEGKKLAL